MRLTGDFPFPWTPDPHAPWILRAANNRIIAHFLAWDNTQGSLAEQERHCALVSEAVCGVTRDPMHKAHPVPEVEATREKHVNEEIAADARYNRNDLRIMQRLVVMWADQAFPDRTPQAALLKLYEEIGELIRNPRESLEYADILIMLVDIAHLHGVHDLGDAVDRKMKINGRRTWKQTSMQHDNNEGS
jgi:NTP pyrophosphatase (non-canonical NTP hydrolase)